MHQGEAFCTPQTPAKQIYNYNSKCLNGLFYKDLHLLPFDITRAGMPVAAMAEQMAYLFWLTFILLCHLLHVFVGANMRPPRHMLPKAP